MRFFSTLWITAVMLAAVLLPHAVAEDPAPPAEVPVSPAPETPAASPLPTAIQHLAPLYEKREEFVAALRAWSKIQIGLADLAMDEAKLLARDRKQPESKAKRDGAAASIEAVRGDYNF